MQTIANKSSPITMVEGKGGEDGLGSRREQRWWTMKLRLKAEMALGCTDTIVQTIKNLVEGSKQHDSRHRVSWTSISPSAGWSHSKT